MLNGTGVRAMCVSAWRKQDLSRFGHCNFLWRGTAPALVFLLNKWPGYIISLPSIAEPGRCCLHVAASATSNRRVLYTHHYSSNVGGGQSVVLNLQRHRELKPNGLLSACWLPSTQVAAIIPFRSVRHIGYQHVYFDFDFCFTLCPRKKSSVPHEFQENISVTS